tara:strand:+ start:329 stop:1582 length:1254 start_codon:yes stop_codon:yes gene_type:complete
MQNLFNNYHFKLKLFFFTLLLIIIFYRSPYILLNGRFINEEGWFWFRNSYIEGPIYGLFQMYWASGYFNLWANLCSVLATIPKVEYAPYVTVYLSLLLKLYIIYYILNSESLFLTKIFYKILTSFIVVVSPPIVPEIWLNSLNSQTFFGILTVLIFFQTNKSQRLIHKVSPYVLLISGLTTLYTCILSPFFFIKYYLSKNKEDLKNFIFIGSATLVQFIIFSYTKISGMQHDLRFHSSIDKFINYNYNVIVKSVLGRETSQHIIEKLSHFNFYHLLLVFLSLLILVIYLMRLLNKNEKDNTLIYLILFFIIESMFAYAGSWGEQVQGRYAVVPGVILLFIFIRLAQNNSKLIKVFSISVILFSLFAGLYEFKHNTKYPSFLICMNCPHWNEEIKIWRNNSDYKIKIWNYPNTHMYLN